MRELLGLTALDSSGAVSALEILNRVCLDLGKQLVSRLCVGRGHLSERLEGLVADPENTHRDTMDRRADYLRSIATASRGGDPLVSVLASSQIVLCVCVLFAFLFLSSIHHSRWGAAPRTSSTSGRNSGKKSNGFWRSHDMEHWINGMTQQRSLTWTFLVSWPRLPWMISPEPLW